MSEISYDDLVSIPEPSRARYDDLCRRVSDWAQADFAGPHPLTDSERIEITYGHNKFAPSLAGLATRARLLFAKAKRRMGARHG